MIENLEKVLTIVTKEFAIDRVSTGDVTLRYTLVMRVLDTAAICSSLLKIGRYSCVPLIMRTQVEAIAQFKHVTSDNVALKGVICQNNNKLISNIESALRSRVPTAEAKSIGARRIRKARHENDINGNVGSISTSALIKNLNNSVLDYIYRACSLHSHNDLNELVALYWITDTDGSVLMAPGPERAQEIKQWAQWQIIVLFYLVTLHHELTGTEPSKDLAELCTIVSECLR